MTKTKKSNIKLLIRVSRLRPDKTMTMMYKQGTEKTHAHIKSHTVETGQQ